MLNLLLKEPIEPLSAFVQAVWSATVQQETNLTKPLYADAGSGIIFNFSGDVSISGQTLGEGVIMLPVQEKAENIVLAPNAKLAGIRFLPAVGYGVLGRHYDRPTLLKKEDDNLYRLYLIHRELSRLNHTDEMVNTLLSWANKRLDFTNLIPDCLERAMDSIEEGEAIAHISSTTHLSHRQIERHFKNWLGMTPKYYQRVLRIKKVIRHLQDHPDASLSEVALDFGFSDQSHMTREFKIIAKVTPGLLS